MRFLASFSYQQAGFTLVEILVVFSILAILSVGGAVSYSNFSRKQDINASAQNLLVTLHSARSKAQSQVTPIGCSGLKGYKVMRCGFYPACLSSGSSEAMYELQAVCSSGNQLISTQSLGSDVVFDSASMIEVTFQVVTGDVNHGQFILNKGSERRTLNIGDYGKITLLQD